MFECLSPFHIMPSPCVLQSTALQLLCCNIYATEKGLDEVVQALQEAEGAAAEVVAHRKAEEEAVAAAEDKYVRRLRRPKRRLRRRRPPMRPRSLAAAAAAAGGEQGGGQAATATYICDTKLKSTKTPTDTMKALKTFPTKPFKLISSSTL